jgi:hypothetical protein
MGGNPTPPWATHRQPTKTTGKILRLFTLLSCNQATALQLKITSKISIGKTMPSIGYVKQNEEARSLPKKFGRSY